MKIYQSPILAVVIVTISISSYARSPADEKTEAVLNTNQTPEYIIHRHMRYDSDPLSGYLNKRQMLGERAAGEVPMDGKKLYETHLHRYDELSGSAAMQFPNDSPTAYERMHMRYKNMRHKNR